MVANFYVKIELVIFFPDSVIYKKIKLIPPEEETLSIVFLLYQLIGETPWNPSQ